MKTNKKILSIIYILLLILCCVIRINVIQDVFIILSSILLVLILNLKFDIKDRKFNFICMLIVIINIFLIYFNYYNSVKLGFQDGLVHGNIGEFMYDDTWNYYYESKYLHDLWESGQFKLWIAGHVERGNAFYGYYNFFVIWNAILECLFGQNLNLFIIIKYQFSIIAIYFLYKISNVFLTTKYSRLAVIIMNFFPVYLLVNISLMRDNIIYFFVLYAAYLIILNKYRGKINYRCWIKILTIMCIITYMRAYIGIILCGALLFYYSLGKFNPKRLIIIVFMSMLSLGIIGIIMDKLGYGFLAKNLMLNTEIFTRWDPEKISSPSKFVFWSSYYTFFGGKKIGQPNLYIGNFLNSISPLFIAMFILPTLFIIFIKINNKDLKYFTIFSYMFSILSADIIFFVFTGIIPRLYICWIWSQFIIIAYLFQQLSKWKCNIKTLVIFQYILYVIVIGVYVLVL